MYQVYKSISCFFRCKIYLQNCKKDQRNSHDFRWAWDTFLKQLTAMETWRISVDEDERREINLYICH